VFRQSESAPATKIAIRAIALLGLLLPVFSASAQELPLRDPMRPYTRVETAQVKTTAPRGFELTAVIISPTRRIAVINGDLYREGDEVQGARISRIEPNSVHLGSGSEERIVPLNVQSRQLPKLDGDSAP
jgi:hypothetical protein